MNVSVEHKSYILGIGIAAPAHSIPQANSAAVAQSFVHNDPKVSKVLPAVYRRTQVNHRGSVVLDGPSDDAICQTFYPPAVDADDRGPKTSTRMQRFQAEAGAIGLRSGAQALADAGIEASRITHLITVTCTGFYAPGFDNELMLGLALNPDTERVQVGFMGCHAIINGLRVARAIAESQPSACVLVVSVELCSLHYQYGGDNDSIIANALFADGSGALVVGGEDVNNGILANRQGTRPGGRVLKVIDTGSRLIANSRDAMTWLVGDHGFQMTLAATVPGLIEFELHGYLESFLGHRGLKIGDIGGWAVHPGGPRVLTAVENALGLASEELAISRQILGQQGNMSSATLVFILNQMRTNQIPGPWLMLGFGPGLEIELALLA